MLIGVGFGRVIGFVWKFKKICSKYWLSLSPPESWRTWLTSILFFMCSGRCSLEGPLERCAGSSGGGGEKCPPLSPSLLEPGESYPLVGGGRRRVVAWPPCISIIHLKYFSSYRIFSAYSTAKAHLNLVFLGLLMKRNIGKYLINTTRIQFGMEWVLGPLKFQLMMITVTRMLTVFMMKVKSKYLAIRGNTREVGGKILETSSKNTTSESKIEIPSVTWNILQL